VTYILIAWRRPKGSDAPVDAATAFALLRVQRASKRRPSSRFLAFGQAMRERFPPRAGADPSDNDVWVGKSESGTTVEPVMTFELDEHSRFFDAAYQHAIVQARRMGLNIYDPAAGEHHLAGSQRFPPGPVIDETTAVRAWRNADWKSGIRSYRRAIAKGSATAVHDLALCVRHGLGDLPVHVVLAGAMMMVAGARDETRRRQRLETLKMLDPGLREMQGALRDELRAAPDILVVVDREIDAATRERRRLDALPRSPSKYTEDDWWSLQLQAQSGDYWAAWRLANAFRLDADTIAHPPWEREPAAYQHYVMLAARLGSSYSQRRIAEGLLAGEGGWPHDPAEALVWMKRALAGGEGVLARPAIRLRRRLRQGWDPEADRAVAEGVLREASGRSGRSRVQLLRRACELDHPDGWRLMGYAYLQGSDGLPQNNVAGAALVLAAQKTFATFDAELGRDKPPELAGIPSDEIDDALSLCHKLLADPDPWTTIEHHGRGLPIEPEIESEMDDLDTLASTISPGRERSS
jgi:TPR repeat protein